MMDLYPAPLRHLVYFRTANDLIESGQAAKAETLVRQALRSGYEPLGTHTYAHTCYTQHLNMLKGWGKEVIRKMKSKASFTQLTSFTQHWDVLTVDVIKTFDR